MTIEAGTRLGPYEILSPIGAGGMGEVYRARDTRLEREVAVKVLAHSLSKDLEALARFEREAKSVAALSHPGILGLYDVGRDKDISYAVTELLDGETLRQRLAAGRLPVRTALDYARQIAEALAAAHGRGIVHRDLKPENVIVTGEGRTKILDFGIARRLFEEGSPDDPTLAARTTPGTLFGTPSYMSPEQVRGRAADARSDIFAAGVLLLEMLSGKHPFRRDSEAETMAAILNEDPTELADPARPLAPALVRLIARCLEKSPEKRFHSARDLALDLEALAAEPAAITPAPKTSLLPSIAVLPLRDMSPSTDQEYFCEGMAEELLNAMTAVRGLRVASRRSSFQFKGSSTDIREIGERLRVSTVLEGSLRKSGDRLRITVQLVNVEDGYQLWSGRFDREREDIFAIQEEIATSVAAALRVVLSEREKSVLGRAPTEAFEAYDFYLRGRQFFFRMGGNNIALAREMFGRAIALDPGYAAAYAGLSYCSYLLHQWFGAHDEDLRKAEEASRRAVELAPDSPEAHTALGNAFVLTKSYEKAEREYRTAIRLSPALFDAHYFLARLFVEQGRMPEAALAFEKAGEVDPDDYQSPLLVSSVYRALGRETDRLASMRRGLECARRHLALHPDDTRALYLGAGALVGIGDRAEGLEWARRATERDPGDSSILYNVACVYGLAGEKEAALETLEKALHGGWGNLAWIRQDSDLDCLHDHPRWKELVGEGDTGSRKPG
jgi:serine/threonine protein kinase/tetratricopeptide (TPR) repeat protein